MDKKNFWQVDAFTTEKYCGNPCGVVFEADDLSSETMQKISREMNLSETIFFLSPNDPKADYRIRIFTPASELPFAGHPTISACYALLAKGELKPDDFPSIFYQQCPIGIIPLEVTPDKDGFRITMTQPLPKYQATDISYSLMAEMLGLSVKEVIQNPIEIVSTGVNWLIGQVKSRSAMERVKPNQSLIEKTCRQIKAVGLTVFCLDAFAPDCQIRLRTFAPGEGVPENPVCGSGNGSVAAYIGKHKLLGQDSVSYQAEQGIEINRRGKVFAQYLGDNKPTVRIGGQAVKVMEGQLFL